MENMQANIDKWGMEKILVQGGIHSTPEERKSQGVLQLTNYRTISLQQSFAEDYQRQNQATTERWQKNRLALWKENERTK